MRMTKEKFSKIKKKYSTLLVLDSDVSEAFEFVRDMLEAEADALKEKCSYATNSIQSMEKAAYEISSMAQEIESGEFGSEE